MNAVANPAPASRSKENCAVCRPGDPWRGGTETCCDEHEEIVRIADGIRKGTATGCWQPQGPQIEQERWRNRADRVRRERDYRRHLIHCIVAQGGKCGDPNKDPGGKGCGRLLLALPSVSVHVDHIMPQKQGGSDAWHNCQALCAGCNNAAGDGSRKDDLLQTMQRDWEAAAKQVETIVIPARNQDGKCDRCKTLLYEISPSEIFILTGKNGDKTVICNSCGEVEIRQRKQIEQEHYDRTRKEKQTQAKIKRRKDQFRTILVVGVIWGIFIWALVEGIANGL